MDYKRSVLIEPLNRLKEQRRFMQILSGPRQTGKTTLARQVIDKYPVLRLTSHRRMNLQSRTGYGLTGNGIQPGLWCVRVERPYLSWTFIRSKPPL